MPQKELIHLRRFTDYLSNSWNELSKVVWPSRQAATRMTMAVIVFSLVLGVFIGIIDYFFTHALQKLILK